MPPEPLRPLALIVTAREFERLHYACAIAAAGGAIGRKVTLFFSNGALAALTGPLADGRPGWQVLAGAAALDQRHRRLGLADFETLLAALRELGAGFLVCEAGLRAMGLTIADLRADLGLASGGLASLLMDAAEAQLVYV
ncbi:MAG: hypothetical protein FJX68_13715 [Alphaproteobacteria bacterium]|nr:hypothetical protein [Alphaproteobacteria bacterium]